MCEKISIDVSNKLQREQWRKWHWKYIKLISGNTRIEIKISPRCSYSLSFRALCNKLFPLNATKRASRSLFSNFPRCRNALPWYFRKAKKPRLWKQFCHLGMTSFRDKHVQKLRKRSIDAREMPNFHVISREERRRKSSLTRLEEDSPPLWKHEFEGECLRTNRPNSFDTNDDYTRP